MREDRGIVLYASCSIFLSWKMIIWSLFMIWCVWFFTMPFFYDWWWVRSGRSVFSISYRDVLVVIRDCPHWQKIDDVFMPVFGYKELFSERGVGVMNLRSNKKTDSIWLQSVYDVRRHYIVFFGSNLLLCTLESQSRDCMNANCFFYDWYTLDMESVLDVRSRSVVIGWRKEWWERAKRAK